MTHQPCYSLFFVGTTTGRVALFRDDYGLRVDWIPTGMTAVVHIYVRNHPSTDKLVTFVDVVDMYGQRWCSPFGNVLKQSAAKNYVQKMGVFVEFYDEKERKK